MSWCQSVVPRLLGVPPATMRRWEADGRLRSVRMNPRGNRRYRRGHVLALATGTPGEERSAAHVLVAGSDRQEARWPTSVRRVSDTRVGSWSRYFHDRRSGLRERGPGLQQAICGRREEQFQVVLVAHADRLARFAVGALMTLIEA